MGHFREMQQWLTSDYVKDGGAIVGQNKSSSSSLGKLTQFQI
jgi:hypothetical protein